MAIELTNTVMRELNQQVYRHIFATCGIPEAVDNYMSDVQHYFTERVTLHLSLHVAGDRDLIMPINKLYPIEETVKKVNQVAEVCYLIISDQRGKHFPIQILWKWLWRD